MDTEAKVSQKFFQVLLDPEGSYQDYILDLDIESLIREVLLPYHLKTILFVQGRELPVKMISRIRIILTSRRIQPELKAWVDNNRNELMVAYRPKDVFFSKTLILEVEYDVTNAIFQRFRESLQWKQIQELLVQAQKAREELAQDTANQKELAQDTDNQKESLAKNRLSEITERIVYLAGVFFAGYQNL